jgi:hypothetical protein
MAYDKDKYQLTHLLQDVWYRAGQMKRWTATGGSATTVINTAWAGVDEPIFEDDDPSLIYGTAIVIQDAGLAGADPEGRFGMITDYDSSNYTITVDTLTGAISVGDRVGIVTPMFPLEDMIEAANLALGRIGNLDIPDISLTAVSGQYEYTLPSAIRSKPLSVSFRNNSTEYWRKVSGWSVIPATAGSNWTLVLPASISSGSLQVVYRAPHPKLTTYDSPILEGVHPELIISATLIEAFQWYNNQVGGSNEYFLQRENKALQDFESAKVLYPILRVPEQVTGFPHWGFDSRYVPGTSDLRG